MKHAITATALISLFAFSAAPLAQEPMRGWLRWRGPDQSGATPETDLPDRLTIDGDGSWSVDIAGRGTPVIAGGRVYAMAYEGEGKDLQEMVLCLEAATGKELWRQHWSDSVTDVIYSRYAIGSPTVDPDNGNVFTLSTAGDLSCFTADGDLQWQRSMMAEYGRLTFPNGRTGAPLLFEDLAIVHVISSSWGPHGPARDRFYAFEKDTGVPVWSCTPGGAPKDSSFSLPIVVDQGGRKVLVAGLGGGNLVGVDARTGQPLWNFPMATGGVNSSALPYGDSVIAVHGKENLDNSTLGRMVRIKLPVPPAPGGEQLELGKADEIWRADVCAFTSSPVLVGNRIYQTDAVGELVCIDADSGSVLWKLKLGHDQLHASPIAGDGKLYVPMNSGALYIVEPSDEGGKILQELRLAGNCLGAPAIADGRIYVHTTQRLYSFAGGGGQAPGASAWSAPRNPGSGTELDPVGERPAGPLQIVPGDVVLQQGDAMPFVVRHAGPPGARQVIPAADVTWAGLGAGLAIADGVLAVPADAAPRAVMVKATVGDASATARLRIVPRIPFSDDFSADLKPDGTAPARPFWSGAGPKWEIRELDGEKVLAKTLDNPLFQRTFSVVGYPSAADYTMQVDILSDGNRRMMSSGGLLHQGYLIALKGNHQEIEISSNMEGLKETAKYPWKAKTWYRLKTRVDVADDGSGTIRAKVWPRDQDEPADWTLEVRHRYAHRNGAPGIWGFVPQSRFRVYLDNLTVTQND